MVQTFENYFKSKGCYDEESIMVGNKNLWVKLLISLDTIEGKGS